MPVMSAGLMLPPSVQPKRQVWITAASTPGLPVTSAHLSAAVGIARYSPMKGVMSIGRVVGV
jgi:hypothetical protein